MMVLAAVSVLTSMGIEFAYNTSVYSDLSQNEANRLKAYYLAKSGYNFMQLELKFNKMFQQIVKSQNLGQFLGANAQLPLCQQFPLSTSLIRTVFLEGKMPGMEGAEDEAAGGEKAAADEEGKAKAEDKLDQARKSTSLSQEQGAQDFLQFEGDFDGECIDEGTKINLNRSPASPRPRARRVRRAPWIEYKQFLFRFLSQPKYKEIFEEQNLRITDVVNNIGDWVDANNEINDFGGRTGGAEITQYQRENLPYQVRSGKLVTLLETYLIAGVTDEWFEPMIDSFTVYGDGTVNVCTASPEVVESAVRRYVDATPNLPPLRLEEPEEMDRLTTAVTDACAGGGQGDQLKQQIAQALAGDRQRGGGDAAAPGHAGDAGDDAGGSGGGHRRRCWICRLPEHGEPIFQLKLAGQSGDTTVRIKAVLDVKETDPKKWKLLYWKVY